MVGNRVRREPPPFRRVTVEGAEVISPLMTRVIVGGPDIDGFPVPTPASSVRLLLPSADQDLVIPVWAGNEFLLPDGTRPIIRTLTPRRYIPSENQIHLDIVHHEEGALTPWAIEALAGSAAEAAVSGPGRGYELPVGAESFLLIGDETAIPAICQLLEHLPNVPVEVLIGITSPEGRVDLHRDVSQRWVEIGEETELAAPAIAHLSSLRLPSTLHVWAAGEAASMQAIRRHLFTDREVDRSRATIRGYWRRT